MAFILRRDHAEKPLPSVEATCGQDGGGHRKRRDVGERDPIACSESFPKFDLIGAVRFSLKSEAKFIGNHLETLNAGLRHELR